MSNSALFFIVLILCFGIYILATLRELKGWKFITGMTLVPTFPVLVLVTFLLNLGQPIPLGIEKYMRHEIEVVSYITNESEGIVYVWGITPGNDVPISVVMPWSDSVVKKLVRGSQEQEENGNVTKMVLSFGLDDAKQELYVLPRGQNLPQKQQQ